MTSRTGELAGSLRQWRDRLRPEDAGLPVGGQRRSPGLRREELALLAGLSVDYLTRLEQGRSVNPSQQVLAALARALHLSVAERDYLFEVAGQPAPTPTRMPTRLTPGLQRLLRRLEDVPVSVHDGASTLIAWNSLWAALLGDPSVRRGRERNQLWQHFTGNVSDRLVRTPEGIGQFELSMVGELRGVIARYPDDPDLHRLVHDLRQVSDRFDEVWRSRPVGPRVETRKVIDHPQVGLLELDCDVLSAVGTELRVTAYTAEPGSETADRLAMLRAMGTHPVVVSG